MSATDVPPVKSSDPSNPDHITCKEPYGVFSGPDDPRTGYCLLLSPSGKIETAEHFKWRKAKHEPVKTSWTLLTVVLFIIFLIIGGLWLWLLSDTVTDETMPMIIKGITVLLTGGVGYGLYEFWGYIDSTKEDEKLTEPTNVFEQ